MYMCLFEIVCPQYIVCTCACVCVCTCMCVCVCVCDNGCVVCVLDRWKLKDVLYVFVLQYMQQRY